MKEETAVRNGDMITQVRSSAGKLLFVKTKEGYEFKCPRSKEVSLMRYEQVLLDCLRFLDADAVLKICKAVQSDGRSKSGGSN